jgi:hypothetical protein
MAKRILLLALLAWAWWTWRGPEGTPGGEPPAPVSTAPPVASPAAPGAVQPAPGGPSAPRTFSLDPRRLFADGPGSAPAPDRVVHCTLGEASGFVRESDCELRGGRVEEPAWARLN